MPGKLIVIEGGDGTGKKTQTTLLVERLKNEGREVVTFSFPQYGKKSAGAVEEYLNNKYGDANSLDPYIASVFYAVDRYDLSQEIRKNLEDGRIVVLDRYVDSSTGHQGGKIADPNKRKEFLKWLYDLEYRIFGIPKPDLVVILHVPADIGQELVGKKEPRAYIKEGTHDGHEKNLRHLMGAENSYLWLAKNDPAGHKLIECVKDGRLMTPEAVHELVYEAIAPVLE